MTEASSHDAPSTAMRRLGRSRRYTRADLPERLRQWHAPRANRWERLEVVAGALAVEWMQATAIVRESLLAGSRRWIAPGYRWRVVAIDADGAFELEIHADDASPVAMPRLDRARLLDAAERIVCADAAALAASLRALAPDTRAIVSTAFDPAACVRASIGSDARLTWHPLESHGDGVVALAVCGTTPLDLVDYLGRDHAVIEAALAGALAGDGDSARWLRSTLARHLVIEERIVFPAWLAAGGKPGWVRGLMKEHELLREGVGGLDDAVSRRRFLLLLDAHDEKEEQIVYPDIRARLGAAAGLLIDAMLARGDAARDLVSAQ